ncbi:MAG: dTDP-4-dehydrorhamnose 3,5-epimerase family protein, partial [Candidatus Margulisiibacteriota bacterium]
GMHFQAPPHDHSKLVTVIQGTILDVILDIRQNSPTYGQYIALELSRENRKSIYIPRGCAHGFCVLSEMAIAFYMTTTVYEPQVDQGILFNSFGYTWPTENPVLSVRDKNFIDYKSFNTPFDHSWK